MVVVSSLLEILRRPTVVDLWIQLLLSLFPLWIAVLFGVLIGWTWKPRWLSSFQRDSDIHPSEIPSSSFSIPSIQNLSLIPAIKSSPFHLFNRASSPGNAVFTSECNNYDCSVLKRETGRSFVVGVEDLRNFFRLVEGRDGGPAWIHMMDRSAPNMRYQAWRRDPESGPPQYRTSSVFEDVTPEIVRDFFWDDGFRPQWDGMLIHAALLEEYCTTGEMVVHWIRKFPFFCNDREYVIGRRIFQMGQTYYCITKGVPSASVPKQKKRPRRVEVFYSSWLIRSVESRSGDGQTACEVLLFHHEDMGIPWEIAKFGVRQGMWGAVRKIEPGLRAYQRERASGKPPSRFALVAQLNTIIREEQLTNEEVNLGLSSPSSLSESPSSTREEEKEEWGGVNVARILVVTGAIAITCSFDGGLLTKAIIFGVARRFTDWSKRRGVHQSP